MSALSTGFPRVRIPWLTIGLLFLALAYTLALRLYDGSNKTTGRIIDDAGRQLYQPVRWLEGQWFYRDFSTGVYQPGAIVWHAFLFQLFGVKMSVIRTCLAVVGAGIAILAYLLARQVLPAGWAIVVYLLSLSWNVFNLNVGYPSWYCALLGLAALLLTLRYVRRGGAWQLALAGALMAVSLAFKVNQGIYQAAGLALGLAWRSAASRPPGGWRSRLLSWESLCAGGLGLAGLAVLWQTPTWLNFLFFGLPLSWVTWATFSGRPRLEVPAAGRRPFLIELVWLGLGWGIASAAWALPTIAGVGWKLFLRGTLLIPLTRAGTMHKAVNMPTQNGWLVLLVILVGGMWLWHEQRVRPLWIVGYGAAAILAAFLPLQGEAGLLPALSTALSTRERLLPLGGLLAAGCMWLWLWRGRIEDRLRAPLALILIFGSWNVLVFYPLTDQFHLLWGVHPLFVALVYLAYRLSGELQSKVAEPRRRWVAPAAIATLLACLCVAQFYLVARHFLSESAGFRPVAFELVDEERADVYMPAHMARAFRDAAQAVRERTDEGDAVFDTCGAFINFIADRRNPTGVDFTWPGLHSPAEEARMVEQLRAERPALILRRTVDEQWRPLGYPSVQESYPLLFEFIESHYEQAAKIREYAFWTPK